MALKDILVCLDPTDAGEHRLRLAALLARQHHAHLSAALVISDQGSGLPSHEGLGAPGPAGAAGIADGSLVAGIPAPSVPPADVSRWASVADIVEQRFRGALQPQSIEGDWHVFGNGESDELVRLVRSFDLAIVGQTSPDYRVGSGSRVDALLTDCGRPLLVVPYAGAFTGVGSRVLVAWDGTREATRALHDALPLIERAEAVTVITVRNREASFERDRPGLDRIAHHLQRHGLPVKIEETLRADLAISDVILSRAADLAADLIVCGAYHHSPMREAMLGGVSRGLLHHMTVPLLMSH